MTTDRVREIVAAHTRLAVDVATLADADDLYSAGLTSHASVNLMLALEDAFDLEFPERLLRRQTFESIAAISAAIDELGLEATA
jgi:acyl carrier protein